MKKEYGVLFREKREEKKISIEKASLETRMTTDVIEALENMHKDSFPSRVHLIGFIRLYSNYLGLDANEMVSSMKSSLVAETPVDFDMLAISNASKRGKKTVIIVIFSVIVAVIAVIIGFVIWRVDSQVKTDLRQEREKETELTSLRKIEGINEIVFSIRERFLLIKEDVQAEVVINSITPPAITVDSREYKLQKNQPQVVILPNNEEYVVILREVFLVRNSLLLRFDPHVDGSAENVFQIPEVLDTTPDKVDGQIIDVLTSENKEEIVVEIIVKKSSLYYRYETEEVIKEERVNSNVAVQAQDFVDIYLAQAAAADIVVNKKSVSIPKNSLPFVFRVRWKIENNAYVLQLIPLP